MEKIMQFGKANFTNICDTLGEIDTNLKEIITKYGYPPMWTRPATFQTLILIILEQQISIASAFAAYKKLKAKVGYVTPQKIMLLTDEEMRACYFTRQKTVYARELATAILNKELVLKKLATLPDEEIRTTLKKIKGIGDWSVDIYLMHALQRTNLFPLGDIALVNSLKEIKNLPKDFAKENLLPIAHLWQPYRTIAVMILWHAYMKKLNIKIVA
jgi:DNA-3-methyladenine glycosylase II